MQQMMLKKYLWKPDTVDNANCEWPSANNILVIVDLLLDASSNAFKKYP